MSKVKKWFQDFFGNIGKFISGNWKGDKILDNNTTNDIMNTLGIGNQRRQNEWASLENEKNRIFNAEQNDLAYERNLEAQNTQFQRKIQDLKTAGINPAIAMTLDGNYAAPATATTSGGMTSSANVTNNNVKSILSEVTKLLDTSNKNQTTNLALLLKLLK